MALAQVLKLHEEGYQFVVDADIQGCFDHIPFWAIKQALAAQVADGNILNLVEKFLRAGLMENGVFKPTTVGTPQGGVFSPLLANIVLNYLDWQLDEHGYRFVRYADDFVVLTQTRSQAEEALTLVAQTLEKLELKLSPDKTRITTYKGGYSFLGFVLSRRSRRMRPKSVQKFEAKVRQLTPRHYNLDATVIEKLNQVIRGTAHYFTPRWATTRRQLGRMDSWLRMRLRAMWSKRKRITDNYRLPNRKFAQLGLLSLLSFCWT
jgi:group II intron reverse transcriptase/maturase